MSIEKLFLLIGTWKGKGTAKFPTIPTTDYIEELEFKKMNSKDIIFYEQRAWHIKDGAKGDDLHWETGYINVKENGNYEVSNSQSNGRVEVLTGKIAEFSAASLHFSLESKLFGNDERMLRTSRDFYLNGNTLRYVLKMATHKTPEFQNHLEANLTKI